MLYGCKKDNCILLSREPVDDWEPLEETHPPLGAAECYGAHIIDWEAKTVTYEVVPLGRNAQVDELREKAQAFLDDPNSAANWTPEEQCLILALLLVDRG